MSTIGMPIGGRIWLATLETKQIVMAPFTTSKRLSLRANAVLLQNAGNCDILLGGGFTLKPDQTYMWGNHSDLSVQVIDFFVQFLPDTATSDPVVRRLEIVQNLTNIVGSGYYIDMPTQKL